MSRNATSAAAKTAPIFAALGDPTRLRVLTQLSTTGPLSIAALTAGADVTRQAITKHLNTLADADLVRARRQGRECIWELHPQSLQSAHRYLNRISQQWDSALQRLKAFV